MVVWFQSPTVQKVFGVGALVLATTAYFLLKVERSSLDSLRIVVLVALVCVGGPLLLSDWAYTGLGLVPAVTLYVAITGGLLFMYIERLRQSHMRRYTEETFLDPVRGNQRRPFPSVLEAPSVDLSLIVAGNDGDTRLPGTLDSALSYLNRRKQRNASFTFEIIVVDHEGIRGAGISTGGR